MPVQNRDKFLDNLAENLGRPRRRDGVARPEWSVNPQAEVFKGANQEELATILEKQSEAIYADFIRTDKDDLPGVLKDLILEEGRSVIASNDPRNDEYGLTGLYEDLEKEIDEVHVWDAAIGKENQVIAERADVGITFSDITLAESATVTLFNNKDNGRTISLLPRTYIAVIPKSTLVPRMTQAAQQIHEATEQGIDVSSCVSFITGPSNSADIEMIKIVGVHGPVKAIYVLVE
ncbi:LutC/YkgG family protein [Virgibacillus ainsalahensis]